MIFEAAIKGDKWQPSCIFMLLLKSSMQFVISLSIIFILDTLINYKQLYESSDLFILARLR